MTRTAYPFSTTPIQTDADWRKAARLWLGTGIIPAGLVSAPVYAPALAVAADASGFNVKVSAGEAWVDGGYYADDTQQTLPINPPDATNPRLDLVVLRWDGPNNVAAPVVLQGTAAATPVAPTPTRVQGGRWEEALGEVRVNVGVTNIAASAVTDRRRFATALGADSSRVNLLVNPDFEFWQRGNGPFTTTGNLTADKWTMFSGGGTMSVVRDSTNQDLGSPVCLALTASGLVTGQYQSLFQAIEDIVKLRGKTVALSMRVRSSATCSVELNDDAGAVGVTVPGNNQWQTVYVTKTIAASPTFVRAQVQVLGNGVTYLNKAMLVVGSIPVEYVPRAAGQDLALCQRYYEVVFDPGSGSFVIGGTAAAAGAAFYAYVPWKVPKAVVPTATRVSTWTVAGCGQPSVNGPDKNGCYLNLTSTAGGTVYATNSTAGNTIIADTGL